MQQTQDIWTASKKKQFKASTGERMEEKKHSLSPYLKDFGKILSSNPAGLISAQREEDIQEILSFANQEKLPVTIRGDGLSQSGQSLCKEGGLILRGEAFSVISEPDTTSIWAGSNATFRDVLKVVTKNHSTLPVIPYNLSLSLGGVLSAGGTGATSFQCGPIASQVEALEVILVDGSKKVVDIHSPLFQALLGGQGCFGFISKACLKLSPMPKQLVTFYLMYYDQATWLQDVQFAENRAYAIEMFCSPAPMGAKPIQGVRRPFSEWLYAMHITAEYEGEHLPTLQDLFPMLSPSKIFSGVKETYLSWAMRHDGRFQAMKDFGQWDLYHPWYECFVTKDVLEETLEEILPMLPLYYCPVLQIAPIRRPQFSGLMMLPHEADDLFACMVLTPGVSHSFLSGSLKVIEALDKLLLPRGGKRYLSGFLGENLDEKYWARHYGERFNFLKESKKIYDPNCILGSLLHF